MGAFPFIIKPPQEPLFGVGLEVVKRIGASARPSAIIFDPRLITKKSAPEAPAITVPGSIVRRDLSILSPPMKTPPFKR